jgi:hypothetical protein
MFYQNKTKPYRSEVNAIGVYFIKGFIQCLGHEEGVGISVVIGDVHEHNEEYKECCNFFHDSVHLNFFQAFDTRLL